MASYDVADRAAFSMVYTANTMAGALMPRFSALSKSETRTKEAADLYRTATAVAAYLASGLGLLACATAPLLLVAWLGEQPPGAAIALRALAVGYAVMVSLTAADVILRARDLPTLAARLGLAFGLRQRRRKLPWRATWPAYRVRPSRLPLTGAAYALATSRLAERRYLELGGWAGAAVAMRSWLPNVVALLALLVIGNMLTRYHPDPGRPVALVDLLILWLVFTGVSLLVGFLTRTVPQPISERAEARGRAPRTALVSREAHLPEDAASKRTLTNPYPIP